MKNPTDVQRSIVSILLALLMAFPAAFAQESVATQITSIPTGARIEVRLNNAQAVRGSRGAVSGAGFVLIDARRSEQQIAFDDVASVKRLKSHTTRNVLIVAGIGVAALAVTLGIILRCGPFGCGKPAI